MPAESDSDFAGSDSHRMSSFTCRSVIELAQKEAELERLVGILRQVMEAAKHWDGTETVEVPVLDKDAAKQLIVQLR